MLLRHPNIVHVFDAGEADAQAYIAIGVRPWPSILSRLRKLLEDTGEPIEFAVGAYIIGKVLEGLDYAHNLVHDGDLLCLIPPRRVPAQT